MSIFDDVLKTKTADPADMARKSMGFAGHLGQSLATGAGAGLAGAAIAGAGVAASKIYDAMTKARDFRAMLGSSFNSDLMDYYRQKPKQFNEAFSSLRSANPSFSKDPMVAGNYMRRIMEMRPESAGGAIVESLSHRKDVSESPIFDAFTRSGTSVAGGVMGELSKPKKTDLKSPEEMEQFQAMERFKSTLRQRAGGEQEGHKPRSRRSLGGSESYGGTPTPGAE
jgi:hypothetical protein